MNCDCTTTCKKRAISEKTYHHPDLPYESIQSITLVEKMIEMHGADAELKRRYDHDIQQKTIEMLKDILKDHSNKILRSIAMLISGALIVGAMLIVAGLGLCIILLDPANRLRIFEMVTEFLAIH